MASARRRRERDGHSFIDFLDPEGQRLRLADDDGEGVPGGVPWADAPVPREFGIRGLGAVDLTVQDLGPTAWTLAEVLEFRLTGEYEEGGNRVALFDAGPGGPGATVRVIESPTVAQAHLGKGGVHHVAFRTPDEEEQRLWRERLREAGLGSRKIDRLLPSILPRTRRTCSRSHRRPRFATNGTPLTSRESSLRRFRGRARDRGPVEPIPYGRRTDGEPIQVVLGSHRQTPATGRFESRTTWLAQKRRADGLAA